MVTRNYVQDPIKVCAVKVTLGKANSSSTAIDGANSDR